MTGGYGGTYTNKPFFGRTDKIDYARDIYGATDARGIAVSPNGKTAVVVTRTPSALLRIDTETRKIVDMASIGTDPSVVQLFEDEDNVYAFVLCYRNNNVYIVEPETMQVYVRSTGSGPHAVTFDKKRKYAYIANFSESTITIIEATPPFNHVRVDGQNVQIMIGKPRLPEDHK
jgi:DNA-binding beta-propeller fold protein YncE